MARRSDHSREELHELALQAAESLVEEQGLEALSTRRIAARIGYTVGSLYQLFKNLDDLILQVNSRTLSELIGLMEASARRADGPRQAVIRLADCYIEFAQRHSGRWRLLYSHQHNGPLPDWFRLQIMSAFGLVEAQLKRLGGSDDPWLASRALWGGIHGIAQLSLSGNLGLGGIESTQSVSHCLVTEFIRGFCNEKP